MPTILEVRDLSKHYGSVRAVDGISFSIEQGICFGLLGPNGAGKTTTIEMIENITRPDSGQILFHGEPRGPDFANRAGIQFQSTALPSFLKVREVLELFARFYPHTLPLDELVGMCQLGDFFEREAEKLSGGQKQRLLLALALVNDPQIVFLDEPTTGLDPQSRRNFWHLIQRIRDEGRTVVLTTHYMDEAETLCDQLLIVDHGRIVGSGSPRQLLEQHLPLKRVCIDLDALGTEPAEIADEYLRVEEQWEFSTASVETTLQRLLAAGADLSSLRVRRPTLEDLFLKLTGHQLRD